MSEHLIKQAVSPGGLGAQQPSTQGLTAKACRQLIKRLHYRSSWYHAGRHPIQHWAMTSRLEIVTGYLAVLGAPELASVLSKTDFLTSHFYGGQWGNLSVEERLSWLRLANYSLSDALDRVDIPEYRSLTYLKLIDAAYQCDNNQERTDRIIVPVIISSVIIGVSSLPFGLVSNGLNFDLCTAIKMITEVYPITKCTGSVGDLSVQPVDYSTVATILEDLRKTALGTSKSAALARWRLAILFSNCHPTNDLHAAVLETSYYYGHLPDYWATMVVQAGSGEVRGSHDWLSAQLDCANLCQSLITREIMEYVAQYPTYYRNSFMSR